MTVTRTVTRPLFLNQYSILDLVLDITLQSVIASGLGFALGLKPIGYPALRISVLAGLSSNDRSNIPSSQNAGWYKIVAR
jgi:hypothetical protein